MTTASVVYLKKITKAVTVFVIEITFIAEFFVENSHAIGN